MRPKINGNRSRMFSIQEKMYISPPTARIAINPLIGRREPSSGRPTVPRRRAGTTSAPRPRPASAAQRQPCRGTTRRPRDKWQSIFSSSEWGAERDPKKWSLKGGRGGLLSLRPRANHYNLLNLCSTDFPLSADVVPKLPKTITLDVDGNDSKWYGGKLGKL